MEIHLVLDSAIVLGSMGLLGASALLAIGIVSIRDVQPSKTAPVADPYATGDWLYDCSDAASQEVLRSIDRLAVRHN